MRYLVFITFLWAFSFSLIDVYLAGKVDGDFAVLTRVILAGFMLIQTANLSFAAGKVSIINVYI